MSQELRAVMETVMDKVWDDPAFRNRLEANPLAAMDEVGIQLSAEARANYAGLRFSEILQREKLGTDDLQKVSGGGYAPPYIPVFPDQK